MSNITRISDLPENITMQVQPTMFSQQESQDQMNSHSYVPLNIHPNPYGVGEPINNELPPIPEASPQRNQMQNTMIQNTPPQYNPDPLAGMSQQHLPSRDIPMDTLEYQQDTEIQPNYVPQVKLTSDYIREYESQQEQSIKKHRERQHREEIAKDWFSDLQFPILVAILYFVFQMPIVNTMMRKIPLLSLHNADGNFSLSGLLFKSLFFGILFYFIQTVAYKLSQ